MQPKQLARGAFSTVLYRGNALTSGHWSIERTDTGTFLVTGEDFYAKSGPDVRFFLSPLPAEAINASNAVEGSLFVKLLKPGEYSGVHRYKLPDGIDLSTYRSVVLHCERYSVLWSTSPLTD